MSAMETALQKAIYTVLSGALSCDIYDDVPQDTDATFPYVTVGDTTFAPFDTDEAVGGEVTVTIHVWSRYEGRAETKGLQDDIYAALHRQTFSVVGYSLIGSLFEHSESFLDSDGKTRHGVSRFRITITE